MRAIASFCMLSLLLCGTLFAAERYNFRTSAAYRALKPAEREKLEQVHRDFVLLWGALDMYAEENQGQVPDELSELVPGYLKDLPRDPFATTQRQQRKILIPTNLHWVASAIDITPAEAMRSYLVALDCLAFLIWLSVATWTCTSQKDIGRVEGNLFARCLTQSLQLTHPPCGRFSISS